MQSRHLPPRSLANGLWLGEVPSELRKLNFIEKLLVARYRHNYFVVSVNKGQCKLHANAIVFAQPTGKMYSVLPPPCSELNTCLAILFTGPNAPTSEELNHTPLFVRHHVVIAALKWLMEHNPEYADVVILEANLVQYSQSEVPVSIIHRRTEGDSGGDSLGVYEFDCISLTFMITTTDI